MAMQNPLFTLNQSLFFHIINNSEIYIYISLSSFLLYSDDFLETYSSF